MVFTQIFIRSNFILSSGHNTMPHHNQEFRSTKITQKLLKLIWKLWLRFGGKSLKWGCVTYGLPQYQFRLFKQTKRGSVFMRCHGDTIEQLGRSFHHKKKFIIGLCRHWFAILFRKKKIVNTSWSDKVEISNILKLSPINIITNVPHVYENRRRGALGVICANTTKSLLGGAVSPIGELGWKKTLHFTITLTSMGKLEKNERSLQKAWPQVDKKIQKKFKSLT